MAAIMCGMALAGPAAAAEAGRDPAKFGIEGWLRMHDADPQRWAAAARGWRRLGADYVMLYPMYRMPMLEDQIETPRRFKEAASGM